MLAQNIVHFSRVLRAAGMQVGVDRVLDALQAVECVGLDRRGDVHAALSAVMLDRHDQQPLFDAAFDAFWKDPKLLERMMLLLLPKVQGRGQKAAPRINRLEEALAPPREARERQQSAPVPQEIRFDAAMSFSERERLAHADFESMTVQEFEAAQRIAAQLAPPVSPVRQRRKESSPRGAIDLRASLAAMPRQPDALQIRRMRARMQRPPIVVLLDISGSMERYARLFLHYAHGLTRRHVHVHTFTFGTRLTPITRQLRHRDPDVAMRLAADAMPDWKGGTRIAAALDEFNRRWARRTLAGNAAVLLVTDGLDRDEAHESARTLDRCAAELRRHAHEVVWLNPLLRYAGFEPRAAGVRALLPHVDRMLPMHNLASLADLARHLREAAPRIR